MKKKVVPILRQEVKVKVDIVTRDIKIYYTEKFQDFTARYIINLENSPIVSSSTRPGTLSLISYKGTSPAP